MHLLKVLLAGCWFCVVASGCVTGPYYQVQWDSLAPDGQTVCFLRKTSTWVPYFTEPVSIWQGFDLCWCRKGSPESLRKVRAAEFRPAPGRSVHARVLISPDSSFAAVGALELLVVVNLGTGEVTQVSLPQELIRGFAWRGPHELVFSSSPHDAGYLSYSHASGQTPPASPPDEGPAPVSGYAVDMGITRQRTTLFTVEVGASARKDYWAPNGKYLVISGLVGFPRRLPDFSKIEATGGVKVAMAGRLDVAWKQDSSGLYANGVVADVCGNRMEMKPLEPVDTHWWLGNPGSEGWTADGRYLLGSFDYWQEKCLINVQTQQEHPVRILEDGLVEARRICLTPAPGLLRASGRDRKYVIDYDGNVMLACPSGYAVCVSADGKTAALVERGTGKVRFEHLPSLPSSLTRQGSGQQ